MKVETAKNRKDNKYGSIIILFFSILISGCNSEDMSEIQSYVQKVKARPAERIEPLPQVKPYPGVIYASSQLPDPFVPPDPKSRPRLGEGLAPNLNRPPEPLEAFPLDSLKMVGTLKIKGELQALVKDSEGLVYQVKVGNYIGSNYGKIIQITDSNIEVNEIISDNSGGWRLRLGTLTMSN